MIIKKNKLSVVSSIGKDFRRSLEVASSSDAWDETNITLCGFGSRGITDFGPEPPVIQKQNKKIKKRNILYLINIK